MPVAMQWDTLPINLEDSSWPLKFAGNCETANIPLSNKFSDGDYESEKDVNLKQESEQMCCKNELEQQ